MSEISQERTRECQLRPRDPMNWCRAQERIELPYFHADKPPVAPQVAQMLETGDLGERAVSKRFEDVAEDVLQEAIEVPER